jgi:hypothetical protein
MRYDRVLTSVGSDSLRDGYVQHPIYVSFRLACYFRKLAGRDGFRVGDLGRILVFLGFTFRVILLERSEWGSSKGLNAAMRELQRLAGGRVKRAYKLSKGSRGVWVNVWFPRKFLETVDLYAKATGESRNNTLAQLLQYGFHLYLISRKRLLRVLQPQTSETRSLMEMQAPKGRLTMRE